VPSAATLNTHLRDNLKAIGDARATWTPTVTPISGSFTSVTGAGRYLSIGKLVIWSATITFTTVNTGVGTRFTLPVTAQSSVGHIGSGRERVTTGNALEVFLFSTSTAEVTTYNNGTSVANGYVYILSGMYEAA